MGLFTFPYNKLMRNFRHAIWNFVHFTYENQGIDFLTWHMNWVYFRYENLSIGFVQEIWNFLCFKYGNLTSDILLGNIEFLYFIYKIWTLIFLHNIYSLLVTCHIWISGWDFPTLNMEFSISLFKIWGQVYFLKDGILYISHLKIYDIWNSVLVLRG